jgi:hypothetical protein
VIVIDNAPEIKGYIERALSIQLTYLHRVIGYMTDDRRPLCAIAFSEFNGANIELTIVAQPGGVTRGVCRAIADYAFRQRGCRRVTVRTKKSNKHAAKMALRAGFEFEAVIKRYFVDDDAVMFRMLKEKCRWL